MKRNFKIYLILFLACVILLRAGFAVAGYNDLISPGDSVTIGEFVYDDDMQPTSSDCTISVYDPTPGDPAVVDGQIMSTSSGGWHYYTVSSVNATGTWPAVMTCGRGGVGPLGQHADGLLDQFGVLVSCGGLRGFQGLFRLPAGLCPVPKETFRVADDLPGLLDFLRSHLPYLREGFARVDHPSTVFQAPIRSAQRLVDLLSLSENLG